MGQPRFNTFNWNEKLWGSGTVQFKINGTFVDGRNLVITDLLTNEANTASFELVDTYTNKPTEGQEIIITFSGSRIFAGRITRIDPEKVSNAGASSNFNFFIECTDWQVDLDKKMVVKSYSSTTLDVVVKDIIDSYTSGITYTNVIVSGAPAITKIIFNYEYVSECFSQLAEQTGWDWYVDYNKDLHFFPQETNEAPIELLDDGEEFDELRISTDESQIVNRVFVRGGYYLSTSVFTQDTITAVAGQTVFKIDYIPHTPFTVTVNAVAKTVGIQNVDPVGSHDFLLNAQEKVLLVDTIVIAGGEAVIMKYNIQSKLLTMVEDTASQATIAAIRGDDGIVEKYITDDTLDNRTTARDLGTAELLKYKNAIVEGTFISTYDGWKSGQRLHIDLTDRNIDTYYLIKEVNIIALAPDKLRYEITFATFLQGFSWFLIKLLDKTRDRDIDTDDFTDEYTNVYESFKVSETVPITTTLTTPPWDWGPGGTPQLRWNLGTWG